MYEMTNSGQSFSDEITNWLIDEAGFKHSQCQMSIYYNYTPYGSKSVVLSYVDGCVYLYTSEELVKWLVDTLRNIFHVNFLENEYWFISIQISQLKGYYISVDKYSYASCFFVNCIDTVTLKENSKFRNTTLPHDMIFTK